MKLEWWGDGKVYAAASTRSNLVFFEIPSGITHRKIWVFESAG
jgi:hypothetical protein